MIAMNIYTVVALFIFALLYLLRKVNPFSEIKLFALGMFFWIIAALTALLLHTNNDLPAVPDVLSFLPLVIVILALITPIEALKYHLIFGYSNHIGFAYASTALMLLAVLLFFILGVHWMLVLPVLVVALVLNALFSLKYVYKLRSKNEINSYSN